MSTPSRKERCSKMMCNGSTRTAGLIRCRGRQESAVTTSPVRSPTLLELLPRKYDGSALDSVRGDRRGLPPGGVRHLDRAIVQSALTMAQPSTDAEMPSSIDALVFELRPHALALAGLAARVAPVVAASWFLPVRRRHLRPPRLPGADWVVLRPRYTGICGSDVFQAFVRANLDNPLSALVSFPHVMGHEIVAQVLRTGSAVGDVAAGAWVAIDPWLGYLARGLMPLCAECEPGHSPLCSRVSEPPPGADAWGMDLGK